MGAAEDAGLGVPEEVPKTTVNEDGPPIAHISKHVDEVIGRVRKAHEFDDAPDLDAITRVALEEPTIQRWLARAGVLERMRELQVDDDRIPPEVDVWAERWRTGSSMVLAGRPGGGKTVAAVTALRRAFLKGWAYVDEEHGRPVGRWLCPQPLFITAPDLYRAVFERNLAMMERAARCTALVIDDFGSAFEHEWPLSEIESLIDRRWNCKLATIVTTNLLPSEFEGTAERSFDRLCDEKPGLVILDGPSRRGGHGR